MLPPTSHRVPRHTAPEVNARIRHDTEARLAYLADKPEQIQNRLDELDREWDIERVLEVNGSMLALTGLFLGVTGSRKWLLLPTAVVGFCLQHALQGWCPPLSVFRRLGIRTQREIDEERYALKALRGDFEGLAPSEATVAGADAPRTLLDRVRN
ncbi:MAG TPA: DUF2892 domain-containing protein [Planctomycetota bacterium]|nr:DUF2892 domain-containing protein [Planctomycetota bacterium]